MHLYIIYNDIWPAEDYCLLGFRSACAHVIRERPKTVTAALPSMNNVFFLRDRTRRRSGDGDGDDVQRDFRRTTLLAVRRRSEVGWTAFSRRRRVFCSERVTGGHGTQKSEHTTEDDEESMAEESESLPFLRTSGGGFLAVDNIAQNENNNNTILWNSDANDLMPDKTWFVCVCVWARTTVSPLCAVTARLSLCGRAPRRGERGRDVRYT